MEPHHRQSIANLVAVLEQDSSVLALVLGGSLAHGFARADSDIDVSIVVSADEYQTRKREQRLCSSDRSLCTYDGYIDRKYVDLEFLRLVAARGSDPARYAYQGARILCSRIEGLEAILADIARYPVEEKRARIERFVAQLLAWRWYHGEALRQQNGYLAMLALQKLVLFGARTVLADNEMFFPYHKWLLRVLASAPRKPPSMEALIDGLLGSPSRDKVEAYVQNVLDFAGVEFAVADAAWPNTFLKDTELRWVDEEPSIDDL